ncbi:uncharacterized protein ASPGLDRAFT_42455 [Aspergillus glaucus CBS 516.65]|uniref:Uncharacterized protein n=1 Tax=Aspergillus glaucus CBS 516.65 TaxID=1160497 RepID=A0A1L9VY83_ASPGL|nr:hypothetical protein ASPGLDRAFT_42455 [Aspergillus glaucus CBS 516.65]OJJ88855.1 hypothetical protein ASPGLDRAFT_42455 [Aspergillus glaucus CBS 516.65]
MSPNRSRSNRNSQEQEEHLLLAIEARSTLSDRLNGHQFRIEKRANKTQAFGRLAGVAGTSTFHLAILNS